MNISPTAIFDSTLQVVDQSIGDFVHKAYTSLVQGNETTITMAFTFYIVLLGYRVITHSASGDLASLTRHGVVMLSVYGLIMSWSLYNMFIYNIFTGEPTYINGVLVSAAGAPTAQTPAQALDAIYNAGVKAASQLFGMADLSNVQYAIYALIVWLVTFLSCVYALGLLIYAKLALAVGLALGPLFLIFILWEGTKGLFESWIKKLVNFALVPIITTCILMLMLSIENSTLGTLKPDSSGLLTFETMGPYICISIANLLLLVQVLPIAASLSGGISLAAIGTATDMARDSFRKAVGAKDLGKQAASRARKIGRGTINKGAAVGRWAAGKLRGN